MTTFLFRKALAEEQLEIFEMIRPVLETVSDVDWPDFSQDAQELTKVERDAEVTKFIRIVTAAISGIPSELVRRVRGELFKYTLYQKPGMPGPRILAGEVGQAFEHLSGFDIYEVMIRSLVVNFIDSWDAIQSRFGSQIPDINLPSSLTSTPS